MSKNVIWLLNFLFGWWNDWIKTDWDCLGLVQGSDHSEPELNLAEPEPEVRFEVWPKCWTKPVMDTGIVTHLSPLTSVYTLSNLPLCSFPLIILLYPTLIHYSYLLYLLLCLILPRVTQYYLYYIYFLNVSASPSFFGNSQTWCCQTSLLGMPHDQHMFGAIPECPGM